MNSTQRKSDSAPQGIHVVAKPIGPLCNLECEYCFYLEKQALFDSGGQYRMSDKVLTAFITSYITAQPTPAVEFVWQGGEPTLLGIDFFKRVVELQRQFAGGKMISNSLQTNGTLLDVEWCRFLKKHNFMVGISLDGPKEIHDRYRRDHQGKSTFDRVMHGLNLLQEYKVDYNVLACVARETAASPLEVYSFLRDAGVEFIQFTPIVERLPDACCSQLGLSLAGPSFLGKEEPQTEVTPWTVIPEEYGDFLIAVYEEWIRHDVGKVFVMNFEWALNAWIGNPSPVCIHAEQCGRSVVTEHNGDVYACDHCVYPEYRLGNILTDNLLQMVGKSIQSGFGITKESALPRWCGECEVLAACRGGCPKHRFTRTWDNEPGLHYLCEGYKKFFLHIRKYLRAMTTLLEHGLPASHVMNAINGPLFIKASDR
ncbi:MAG: anaerobic sulfatase maturase [Deltaproteobacteria bacterium]|nr:anaerobic sulfatase maturase [Deltaproteobacteria bacterium]